MVEFGGSRDGDGSAITDLNDLQIVDDEDSKLSVDRSIDNKDDESRNQDGSVDDGRQHRSDAFDESRRLLH